MSKFRLEAVLRLRKIQEDQARVQLGRILAGIRELEKAILRIESDIEQGYSTMDAELKESLMGLEVGAYGRLIEAGHAKIEEIREHIQIEEGRAEEAKKALVQARAKLKLLEKMEEKHNAKVKKEFDRKQHQKFEEMVRLWRES